MLCARRLTSLRRHVLTSSSTSGGTCVATLASGSGSRLITAASVPKVEPPRNARRPDSIS